jgi:hypothetical protein
MIQTKKKKKGRGEGKKRKKEEIEIHVEKRKKTTREGYLQEEEGHSLGVFRGEAWTRGHAIDDRPRPNGLDHATRSPWAPTWAATKCPWQG